jgi:hypothetical protein
VLLATQEAKLKRTAVCLGETLHRKRAGGVAQGIGPEFQFQLLVKIIGANGLEVELKQ